MVMIVPSQEMIVASVVSNIFFQSKIESAVKRYGSNVFCESATDVKTARPDVILVDLEHPHAAQVLREHGNRVIAFGPQPYYDKLSRLCKEFGAKAYPRSFFFDNLDRLLHNRL